MVSTPISPVIVNAVLQDNIAKLASKRWTEPITCCNHSHNVFAFATSVVEGKALVVLSCSLVWTKKTFLVLDEWEKEWVTLLHQAEQCTLRMEDGYSLGGWEKTIPSGAAAAEEEESKDEFREWIFKGHDIAIVLSVLNILWMFLCRHHLSFTVHRSTAQQWWRW